MASRTHSEQLFWPGATTCRCSALNRRNQAVGVHRRCTDGLHPRQDALGEDEGCRSGCRGPSRRQEPPHAGALFRGRPRRCPLDRGSMLKGHYVRINVPELSGPFIIYEGFVIYLCLCLKVLPSCAAILCPWQFPSRRFRPPRRYYRGVQNSTRSHLTQCLGP